MRVILKPKRKPKGNGKIPQEQFVLQAIHNLRDKGYKGIHNVYSGFNELFREYFEGADPVLAVEILVAQGKVVKTPRRGGFLIFDASELTSKERAKYMPPKKEDLLKKILG